MTGAAAQTRESGVFSELRGKAKDVVVAGRRVPFIELKVFGQFIERLERRNDQVPPRLLPDDIAFLLNVHTGPDSSFVKPLPWVTIGRLTTVLAKSMVSEVTPERHNLAKAWLQNLIDAAAPWASYNSPETIAEFVLRPCADVLSAAGAAAPQLMPDFTKVDAGSLQQAFQSRGWKPEEGCGDVLGLMEAVVFHTSPAAPPSSPLGKRQGAASWLDPPPDAKRRRPTITAMATISNVDGPTLMRPTITAMATISNVDGPTRMEVDQAGPSQADKARAIEEAWKLAKALKPQLPTVTENLRILLTTYRGELWEDVALQRQVLACLKLPKQPDYADLHGQIRAFNALSPDAWCRALAGWHPALVAEVILIMRNLFDGDTPWDRRFYGELLPPPANRAVLPGLMVLTIGLLNQMKGLFSEDGVKALEALMSVWQRALASIPPERAVFHWAELQVVVAPYENLTTAADRFMHGWPSDVSWRQHWDRIVETRERQVRAAPQIAGNQTYRPPRRRDWAPLWKQP